MSTEEIPSVLNHEAFAAKYLPDLGHNVKGFQVFHWKLLGWEELEKRVASSEFDCGGHKWHIYLSLLSDSNIPPNDNASIYLYCIGPKDMIKGWHACTQFALAISNPHDPTIHTVGHTHRRFTGIDSNRGFTHFKELTKTQPGRNRPIIEEDSAVVSAYVRVLEDPTGVLWDNYVNYDSKRQTGYVGLKNQGATAYMNAELQFLFHIHCFRKVVYQIPTENQHPTESVLLAVQRVFCDLQTFDKPVDTTELTKSLGWKPLDPFMAHDAQEFHRVFQRKLEFSMKGTRAEGTISKLFRGKMKILIRCVNVNYEESKIEEFDDIQLEVKGIKTLQESFRDYIAVETLDGERRYHAEGLGPQDARKSTIFQSFPPVLYLQLKRYEYDVQLKAMVKINDRFEFPFEIDLDEFLHATTDKSKPWKYELHTVLVHSGDLDSGHSYALIKPDRGTQWFKFDDDRVTPVKDREVLEGSYGGEPPRGAVPQAQDGTTKVSTNAYILAYIRRAAIDEVMPPLTEEDIPLRLEQTLDGVHGRVEAKRREQDLFLTVKVVTDESFSRHEGFDLAVFDKSNSPSDLPTFRVLKQETYSAFKSRVAQHFSYSESQIRLWVLVNRQNKTVRPDTRIPENEPSLTVEVIRNNTAVRQQSDLRLYLETFPGPSKSVWLVNTGTIMIFLKHFDATKQSLFGIGKIRIARTNKMRDLVPIVNEKMGWASGTLMKLYEEIKPGMIELVKPDHTFIQTKIQDGDIICFQVNISDQEVHSLESQKLCSNPQQFYKVLENRTIEWQPTENR